MKKLLTLLVIAAFSLTINAQSPNKMTYQSVIRDNSGGLITNQAIGMRISILQGSATGTIVFSETYSPNPQTNANGLVSIEIGGGTATVGTFAGIDWSAGIYFLKTETDPAGGTSYTITGTSQLLSVPYALYAKASANGFSGNYNDLTNKPSMFSGSYLDLTNKPALFDGTWSSLTGKPSFATVATSGSYNDLLNKPVLFSGTWADITGKPTTLAGYGITDADNSITNEIQALSISGSNLSLSQGGGSVAIPGDNWGTQTAVTDATLTGNGITAAPLKIAQQAATTGQVLKWSGTSWSPGTDLSGSSIWSQSGSNIYFNSGIVGIGTSNPATFIHAHGSPVASRGQLSLSAPAGEDTFISFYQADIFKAYLWFDATNQDLRLQNFTAGALNLNPYGGNVGIGTNTPSATLDVSGTIKATSFAGDGNSLTNIAVPDNSINSQKIINGTIQNEDIAADAIDSNNIQDGSITAVDIADEPAVKEANSIWIKMSSTCASLRSMSVTAPADGKLLVMATGTLSLQKSSTTEAYWRLDLNTVANDCSGSVPAGSTPKSASRGNIPASWTFTNDFGLPFNIQEVYTVTKGATYNFYINGDAHGFSSDVYLFHPTIVAIYIPSSL